MARKISVGIDIGTYQVKIMIAEEERLESRTVIKIIGTGFGESKGLRHGYIINQTDVTKALKQAVAQAEKAAGLRVRNAYLSVGGIGLSSVTTTGTVAVSRADSEITDLDVTQVIEAARANIPQSTSINRRVIHTIPVQYRIDGKPVLGSKPVGMKASKLEAKVLFVNALENHLYDLEQAVEDTGIEVKMVIAAPLAASLVTLTKQQKIAGSVLANIGAETVSIVVFENNIPISLETFQIGSNDITNDIALGLKIPLEEAERIKLGAITGTTFPKKKLDDIIEARLSDILDLIEAHLKKIGRSGLLPAGIILTGGGSGIAVLEELAKAALSLPSRIASMNWSGSMREPIKDASWSVAYGLCRIGLSQDDEEATLGVDIARKARGTLRNLLHQLLP
ncbi:MAG TPA: cell division protein FtsA [Candidatus Paceibacterota bacterium]